jgi:HSP20 family protein
MLDWTRWDPFRDFAALRREMDRLIEQTFNVAATAGTRWAGVRTLPVDVYETPDAFVIKASVPGADPDSVTITFEQNVVTIRGQIPGPSEQERDYTWHIHELGHGEFARTIALPLAVQADQAEATYTNGLLMLRVPKAPEVRPRQIRISSQPALTGQTS